MMRRSRAAHPGSNGSNSAKVVAADDDTATTVAVAAATSSRLVSTPPKGAAAAAHHDTTNDNNNNNNNNNNDNDTNDSLLLLQTPQAHQPVDNPPVVPRRPLQRLRRRFRRRTSDPDNNNNHQQHHHHHRHHRNTNLLLLHDHYRVDPVGRVVLPGVPRYEADWARDAHDLFNLAVLVPVVALNVMNWNWDLIFYQLLHVEMQQQQQPHAHVHHHHDHRHHDHHHHHHHDSTTMDTTTVTARMMNWMHNNRIEHLQDFWTGEWFDLFFQVTALYFCVDLLWIVTVPHCVKSPSTIIQHHMATILYILIPYHLPEFQWLMGALLSVEINTWFLIARRVLNKQGFPPWTIKFSWVSIRVKLISICFYITWIAIRVVLYPALFLPIVDKWWQRSVVVHTKWNMLAVCIPLHATFCLLNVKWTHDLIMSKVRYWRRPLVGSTGSRGATAASLQLQQQEQQQQQHSKGL